MLLHQHSNLRVGIVLRAFGNERKAAQCIGRLLRLSPEETAAVHLLMHQDTVDGHWLVQALAAFDPAKISYVAAATPRKFFYQGPRQLLGKRAEIS